MTYLIIIYQGLIQGGGGGGGGGKGSPGIPPKRFLPAPPRIFIIKFYINEISYVIHYSNGKKSSTEKGT